MKRLRTASTKSLIVLGVAVLVVAISGTAIAVAAKSDGPVPPAKPLTQALHDALAAPEPAGVTARISFTNNLFPSGALGINGSPLMTSGSGRLWLTNDGHGRLELQSDAGDAQVVWGDGHISVYDASSNTVYKATFAPKTTTQDTQTPPTVEEIQSFLDKLGQDATISDAQPTNVAGQPAYRVTVSPKHDGGLLGQAELAWDTAQGVPLHVAIYAQGSSTPALALTATEISYGPVAASDVNVAPPASAKVVDLSGATGSGGGSNEASAVTGLAAVQAAASFPVSAPDTLVGLPRQDVRLVGPSDDRKAIVVYGHGLGAIVVVESAAQSDKSSGVAPLPSVAIDGATGHELATQLGTAVLWQRGGVDYVLAGSVPPAAAEAAARQIG